MMTDTITTINIDNLRSDYIDAKPVDKDWSEGWGETWDLVYPDWSGFTLAELVEVAEDYDVTLPERDHDLYADDDDYAEWVVEVLDDRIQDEGGDHLHPMMNYAYPIAADGKDQARLMAALLPLSVISDYSGDTYLALTGGGMDLSWEICHAYMICGYLPPVHFAGGLPRMAFSSTEAYANLPIAMAAVKSCEIASIRATGDLESARARVEWLSDLSPSAKDRE